MRKVYLRKHSTIYWNNTEPGLSQGGNGKCFISHSILEFMRTTLSLDLDERDQLKELLNIGVSHAGTKLSQMAGRRVAISVPQVSVERAETIATFVDEGDEVSVAVLLRLTGGMEGYALLYFPQRAATQLLRAISGKDVGDLRAFDAYDRSVFQEVGNILAGGMLSGLSEFLHAELLHSVPDVVIDMGGAMFNSLSAALIASHEEFLSSDVAIEVEQAPVSDAIAISEHDRSSGRMFLFLGPEATKQILAITSAMVS